MEKFFVYEEKKVGRIDSWSMENKNNEKKCVLSFLVFKMLFEK